MTSTAVSDVVINTGPSWDRVWDAGKYAFGNTSFHLRVDFTCEDGLTYWIRITGIRHDDGSGHRLNFVGNVVFIRTAGGMTHTVFSEEKRNVRGHYDSHNRSGLLQFSSLPLPLN